MPHSRHATVIAVLASATLHLGVSWVLDDPWWQTWDLPGSSLHGRQSTNPPLVVRRLHVPTTPSVTPPQLPAPAEEASSTPPPVNSAVEAPVLPGSNDETPAYWPRKLLDVGPSPANPVILPPPEDVAHAETQGHAVLELFIDEHGHVDRIEVLDSNAPATFVDAAKESFRATLFTPGLKDNQPVPSRIKIEVRYE